MRSKRVSTAIGVVALAVAPPATGWATTERPTAGEAVAEAPSSQLSGIISAAPQPTTDAVDTTVAAASTEIPTTTQVASPLADPPPTEPPLTSPPSTDETPSDPRPSESPSTEPPATDPPASDPPVAAEPPATDPAATTEPAAELVVAAVVDNFAIAVGDTVSDGLPGPGAGNIEAGGNTDSYTFAGTAGAFAILDVLAGRNTDFRWALTAPDGTAVFDTFYADRLVELSQDGTYTLVVRGASPTDTGSYSFRLLAPPTPQVFPIAVGDTVSDGVPTAGAGNIEAPGAADVYTFAGAAGEAVIFDHLAGRNTDIRWRLETAGGPVLFSEPIGDRQVVLPADANYTLSVAGSTIDDTGSYSFRLSAPPTPQVFPIAVGDTVSDGVPAAGAGNIDAPGAADIYTFSGAAGQVVIFDHLAGRNADIRWRLETAGGPVLFSEPIGDRQVVLPADANYLLIVAGLTIDDTGTYSFQLVEVPPAEEFDIVDGDIVSDGVPAAGAGNIEAPGATDIYTFPGVAGRTAILDHISGSNVDLGWSLVAPDGSVLFDTFIGDQEVPLPASGMYTLTVAGLTIDDTGTYSFKILGVTPPPQRFLIAFGDNVSPGVPDPGAGSIEEPGAADVYTFEYTGNPAGLDVIAEHVTGSNVDLGWRLEAPDGSELFDTFLSDQRVELPSAGTYTLTVDANDVDSVGTYSFRLLDVRAPERFAIAIGDTVSENDPFPGAGSIEQPGDQDIYTLAGTAGQDVLFSRIAFGFDLAWSLAAPDGSIVFDSVFTDRLVTLPQTGTYTLTVDGEQTADFGTYEFQLLDVSGNIDEFAIAIGDIVSDGVPGPGAGNIEVGGAVDIYTFEAVAGQEVVFDDFGAGTLDHTWELTAPDGSLLFSSFLTAQQPVLPVDGTYRLAVFGSEPGDTGTYRIRLFEVPAAQEFAIEIGDTVSDGVPAFGAGNIELPSAVDIYTFRASAGEVVVLDVLTRNNDLAWTVTAPDGTTVLPFTFLNSDQSFLPTQTGRHTITVAGFSVGDFGSYSFQLVGDPDTFAIEFGDTVSDGAPGPGAGNLEQPGSIDSYAFDAEAGQQAAIDVLSGSLGFDLDIFAPDGTEIPTAPVFVDAEATVTISGPHTIVVTGGSAGDTGTYSFQLLDVTPANRDPVAVDDAASTDEDTAATIDVLANDGDPDGDALTIDAVTDPANGTATIGTGDIVYTPDADFDGADTFNYRITDGEGGRANATVTVAVEPLNDDPTIGPMEDQADAEGDAVALGVTADDLDGDALTFSASGLPDGLSIDAATGTMSGTIALGAAAGSPYTVTVTVTDPAGAGAEAAFVWTVTADDEPLEVDVDVVTVPRCIRNDGSDLLAVVIFGDAEVRAGRIDAGTVQLESMPAASVFGFPVALEADVNGDGLDDLTVLIESAAGGIPARATTATVIASLRDGTAITGTDAICVRR